jgi:hypothetical protein
MDERDVMVHLSHLRDIRRERCRDRLAAQAGVERVSGFRRMLRGLWGWITSIRWGRIPLPERPPTVRIGSATRPAHK